MLAAEYGWTKDYILDHIYPDDIPPLQDRIAYRKLRDYRMMLVLHHAEKPAELMKTLDQQMTQLKGIRPEDEQLDRVGLRMLKQRLSRSKAIKVKS